MDLKTFFTELLKQYGIYTTVAVIIVLFIAKDLWTKLSDRLFAPKKKEPVALKDHSAFKEFDRIIEHTLVNDFKCECPIRKALYRDIMLERMKCFRKKLYEFSQTDLNSKELYPTQRDFYLKVVSVTDEANAESKKNSIANGIPEFVLETLEKHRIQMRDVLGDMLKIVCYAEYVYATNTDRMRVILSLIVAFCKNYMDMLEELLASYNGDIKTLDYKGIICKNCKICIHDDYIKRMKATLLK